MGDRGVIGKCPMCTAELRVSRLECGSCGTRLEGSFSLGPFQSLSADQLAFVEAFIRARGNFRDLEREMGLSYPTLRSRLDAVIRALGFQTEVAPDREAVAERRKEILRQLAEGKIAPDDAAALLEEGA